MVQGRNKLKFIILYVLSMSAVHASAVDTLQDEYRAEGAGPFSAVVGEKRWLEKHKDADTGQDRNCQSCHGKDLTIKGKHPKTGKIIDPLAPSVNNKRLTDIKFIKKWFKRNCIWALGRECTAQEKGDFLEYLKTQ
ncbi:DUF1924 domain-containing protein [Pseudomonadota bacterium]